MLTPGLLLAVEALELMRPDWPRISVAYHVDQCIHQGRDQLDIARALFVLAADPGIKSPVLLPLKDAPHWLAPPPTRPPAWYQRGARDAVPPEQVSEYVEAKRELLEKTQAVES